MQNYHNNRQLFVTGIVTILLFLVQLAALANGQLNRAGAVGPTAGQNNPNGSITISLNGSSTEAAVVANGKTMSGTVEVTGPAQTFTLSAPVVVTSKVSNGTISISPSSFTNLAPNTPTPFTITGTGNSAQLNDITLGVQTSNTLITTNSIPVTVWGLINDTCTPTPNPGDPYTVNTADGMSQLMVPDYKGISITASITVAPVGIPDSALANWDIAIIQNVHSRVDTISYTPSSVTTAAGVVPITGETASAPAGATLPTLTMGFAVAGGPDLLDCSVGDIQIPFEDPPVEITSAGALNATKQPTGITSATSFDSPSSIGVPSSFSQFLTTNLGVIVGTVTYTPNFQLNDSLYDWCTLINFNLLNSQKTNESDCWIWAATNGWVVNVSSGSLPASPGPGAGGPKTPVSIPPLANDVGALDAKADSQKTWQANATWTYNGTSWIEN
jgi:hypothetical protein